MTFGVPGRVQLDGRCSGVAYCVILRYPEDLYADLYFDGNKQLSFQYVANTARAHANRASTRCCRPTLPALSHRLPSQHVTIPMLY